jgi:hypothetical protein
MMSTFEERRKAYIGLLAGYAIGLFVVLLLLAWAGLRG